MNKLILVSFLVFSQMINAQLYVDDFDKSINSTTTPPTGFTITILNENLQIEGDGSGAMWAAMNYNIHNNGTSTFVDVSSSPKLYIKAKASVPLEFRIDLRDETGYVTNLNANSVNLTNNFQVYELDYTGKLLDGAFGGPCTTGPCNVDPSKIVGLSIFAKPGVGGYSGTIDIDWISLGSELGGNDNVSPKHSIRLNRVGYFTGKEKIISVNSSENFTGLNYSIKNQSGAVVKSGVTGATSLWNDAQEYVTHIDISDMETEGEYTIEIGEVSENFRIGNNIYDDLANAVFKYYYYNRASTEITDTYGGKWARETGIPDTSVKVHSSAATSSRPEGTVISGSKGWYDAGDYNKYIVNSGISTYTLLAAFEQYGSYYKTKEFDIPESGNALPDILDEVIWNLDWMLAMQDPNDGGVYHKLTGLNFSGIVMPKDYNFDRYVVKKSTSAALNFAAVMAIASRIFNEYNTEKPGYSAQLIQAAKNAYTWAKSNPTDYFTNPTGVVTGEYGDTNVQDEFQWAASELFITTKENQYKSAISIATIPSAVPSWQQVGALALFSINTNATSVSSDLDVTTAKNMLLMVANELKSRINNSAMKIAMDNTDYVWGSNGVAGNQLMYLLKAFEITNDASYLNAVYTGMDYLLGRNGLGTSFITGFGLIATSNPHHRISEADGVTEPVPGMVAGGPQPGQQDGCSYPSNLSAKSYSDTWCSYASNEVTINWNAPLVYVVNALRFYQNSGVLSVNDETINKKDELVMIYPNPSNGELHIKSLNGDISSVSLYTITGKKIKTSRNPKKIDINSLNSGVYLLRVTIGNKEVTRKIIKK